MFKTKKNQILTILLCRVTQIEHIIFSIWVPLNMSIEKL